MYCLNMLRIAVELARENPAYADVASKFLEHFAFIAHAMSDIGGKGLPLWDDEDGFFYDNLHLPDGSLHKLKTRSAVGLIPLFAVETLEPELVEVMPGFKRRLQWFIDNVPNVREHIDMTRSSAAGARMLLALVNRDQLVRVLGYVFDETEFLSKCGLRSLSAVHRDKPYSFPANGCECVVDYEPAESTSGMFGGNSNWRGPVWFPLNFLLIESLQKFHYYYGDSFKVEYPSGSGTFLTLWQAASELSRRLSHLFLRGADGRRPVYGNTEKFQSDPHWRDLVLFHEYFHGDTGAGLGASHQTGWTALVAKLLQQSGG
ncbi:MAG: hypothetical protein HY646_08065 [Acidobacteria bacterium]|nr:hypothetical protein [Acidobacteriota bacterium]